MNQEYVLLGGLFWKMLGKKIFMWRNHKKGGFLTKIAGTLSNKVFYTSDFSFTAKFKNAMKMPVGIDVEKFGTSNAQRVMGNAILSLGRIDPVKRVHILVDALKSIGKLSLVDIYGDGQGEYYNKIKKEVKILNAVPNNKTPEIYSQHDIFINMTPSGSFDKTIIEAMASGLIPIVCNEGLSVILPKELIFKENDAQDLSVKIEYALNIPQNEKESLAEKFRKWAEENHSLNLLVKKLTDEFKSR
jgi:glycosyltransferase involved in cell wall biosynthesis